MAYRFRLVPLAIVGSMALLGLKATHLWFAIETVPLALAQAPAASAPAAAPTAPPVTPPLPAGSPPAAAAPPPPSAPPAAAGDKPRAFDPMAITPTEVELLQKLAERRAELDKRAAEISQREVLLQATEQRIDEKIAKLAALEKEIGGIADKQSAEDDARIKSLVKIYETMKPQDAARILEQLDMPVLLGVVEHMKELKTSAILASMDPGKARAITDALAMRRDSRGKSETAAKPKS